jgi:hypothetical protein
MKLKMKLCVVTVLISLVAANPVTAQNQWAEDGNWVAGSNATLANISAVSDGQGGAFLAFENNADLYAQWINGNGSPQWGIYGKTVNIEGLSQKNPGIASDAAGGIYIGWVDEGTNRVKVQHLDSNGNAQWAVNGIYVTETTAEQSNIEMVADGNGGVILVWQDSRNYATNGIDIWAQRLDNQGNRMWGTTGKVVTAAVENQTQHAIALEGTGRIVVVWTDYRNGFSNKDIYTQHLNAAGDRSWHISGNYDGIPVCSAANDQNNPAIVKTGGKICMVWADKRNDQYDIYAHMIEVNGSATWPTTNGTVICNASGTQSDPRLCPDSNGGVIITWQDQRTAVDIYAQRMGVNGAPVWDPNGKPVNTSSNWKGYPDIVSDDAGGATIAWMELLNSVWDIYGQHLDASGDPLWSPSAFPLCTAANNQFWHTMITDGSGGAITMWQDGRAGEADIYAQKTNDNLTFISPTEGELWAGSHSQTIEWSFHSSQIVFDYLMICVSSEPGDGFPTIITTNADPAALSQTWTPGSINSTTVQLMISAWSSQNIRLAEFTSDIFTIDSEPPGAFNLTAPANNAVVDLQPTFQWHSASDNLSGLHHYELVIDGQTVQASLQNTQYTLTSGEKLSDGLHQWFVRAVDEAGQVRQSAAWSLTAAEDNTPPNPFDLVSPGNNSWSQSITPAFTWQAATDDITGIHHYKLFVDGGVTPIADLIPPATPSISSVTLAAGSHTWTVVAVDSAMNERQANQTWTVNIDNVIPEPFSLISPGNQTWHNTATPTLIWQASQDAGCGLAGYELHLDGDSTPWIDNISSGATQLSIPGDKAFPEGSHTWNIIAKDQLGNSRASSVTFTIGIDITPPAGFNLTLPAENAFLQTASPALSWQGASDAVSSIAEYELYVDDNLNRDNLSVTSITPVSALSEGNHTWQVKAKDIVGNTANSAIRHFIVDTQGPLSFNLISPSPSQTVYHNQPTFSWQATTDVTTGLDHYELSVDDVKIAEPAAQQTQYTMTNALTNGNHTWKVIAVDKAGNTVQAGPQNFTTQVTAPVITSPAAASGTEDVYFSYTATATDAENDVLSFTFENCPPWMSANGATISGTPTEGITGANFTVRVSDGLFAVTLNVAVTITAVDDPPHITSPASAEAVEDQNFIYTITATDPENDPISYTFSDYPDWMSVSGATIQGSPPEGITSVTFNASAAANGKSDVLTVTISVAGVDDPPHITSANSANAVEDIVFNYTASATDPENDPITFSFTEYPGWLSVSGATIEGIPIQGITGFTFKVTAAANGKTDQKTVTVTVQPVDDAPVITSPDAISATEDILFQYTATASDEENDPVTLTFSQVPDWMSVSGNCIQGVPPEGLLSATFMITATANGKTDQMVVTVSITAVDDPPRITSPATGDAIEDILFSYTATATDIENDPVSFMFSDFPNWMSVSGAVIQGAPPNAVTSFNFTVTAMANGKTDQKVVTVTVQAVNDPPHITSADSVTATEYQTFTYTATAIDEEGDELNIEILDLPSWLQRDGNTVSGTPGNLQPDTCFTVIALAGSQSDTQTVVITMIGVNDPPVITSPDSTHAVENTLYSYQVEITDCDGPQLSVRFALYPSWLKPFGKIIRGTVPANCQNSTFQVIVCDNHPVSPLTDTLMVTILVEQVNDPPVFTVSFPDPSFQDPDTIRWTLALDDYVNDPDNPDSELTWSYTLVDSQNVSVQIDPVSHHARIVAFNMASRFKIAFRVTDPGQASASDTLVIGVVITAVDPSSGPVPVTWSLSPNMPNPFNPVTSIMYGIPKTGHVCLTIHNTRGQIVAVLADEVQTPGIYQIRWDAADFASGLYFCQMVTDEWRAVRRMILLK